MSNEENVPSPSKKVDPGAFQRAARKHNNQVVRKQRLQTGAKLVAGLIGLAVCVLAVIWTTQWLVASRATLTRPSERPEYLVVLTATIGAILIVGGILAGVWYAARLAMATHDTVGFSVWSVTRTTAVTLGIAFAVVVIVGVYLALVFYS